MLKNYLKIAWRNLWRNKTFTLLNLGGLAISLAACIIVFCWVYTEKNYDRSAAHADRVFRVNLRLRAANQPDKDFAVTAAPLAAVVKQDFPEVEQVVRIASDNLLLSYKDQHFYNDKFFYADPSFFDVFGFPLLEGNPKDVLSGSNSAVVTESMAKKYFGNPNNAIGKTISYNDSILLQVTGVAKDIPAATHFHFDILCSFKVLERVSGPDIAGWWNDDFWTYILLKNPASAASVDKRLATIMDKYNGAQNRKIGFEGIHFLQPVRSIHLYSNLRGELEPSGSISSLRIFTGIGIFLLLIACINYINLTTANSFRRAKEIGMRKVTGAVFGQLVIQFLGESVIVSVLALMLAIGLASLSLPFFNGFASTQISLLSYISIPFIILLVLSAVALGIIAGIYPAFHLSRIQPVSAFKNMTEKKGSMLSLRKILVILQFSLSIILIIATIVALQQLHFMQTQSLGLDKEQVLAIPIRNQSEVKAREIIIKEFEKNAAVISATSSSSTPGKGLSNIVVLPEGVAEDHIQTMNTLIVDYDFISTYKMSMAAGRPFSHDFGGDSSAFILNETAVKELGWGSPERAIGKKFNWGLGKKGEIIGVVKDFHFNSLQKKPPSVVMHMLFGNYWYNYISLRINTQNPSRTIGSLETVWKSIFPDHPFDYFFVDQDFSKQYQTEQRLSNLSILFSMLTIFISCLGLLGLVMVAVSQRTKEIGVRKVLGASVSGITMLISKDFLKLVGIAILIATPVAWYLMNQWLQHFDYRISIRWWVFVLSALFAILIALATISFKAIGAAVANPVNSLRSE